MSISVIIPTYRPQDYLWQCLCSLNKQTLSKDQWELLLVLNGDKDPYYSQIQDYIAKHTPALPVRLIYSEQGGVSHARNIGLDQAQGEYIIFIDDDDYVSPTYLEKLFEKASDSIVSLCNLHAFSEQQNHLPSYFETAYQQHAKDGLQPYYKARKFFSSSCLKLMHRDIIGDRRFSEQFKNGEDSLFMFLISDRLQDVRFTSPDAVYYRRVRTNSASTKVNKWQQIRNCLRMMNAYTQIYMHGTYNFNFYLTRLLGAIHTMLE